MLEIERKYLVKDLQGCLARATTAVAIFQGYLSNNPASTVRVRIQGDKAFLTIKGASSNKGTTRVEWEKEISIKEANVLLPLCLPGTIHKTRHIVPHKDHFFEVDVFKGYLSGLVIAEVELNHAEQKVDLPCWIGNEVTGDNRYYNSQLALHGIPHLKT